MSSRFRGGRSYGHRIQYLGRHDYRISWTVDFYYRGSRQRHPRAFHRDTDVYGAMRFAEKWGIKYPEFEGKVT